MDSALVKTMSVKILPELNKTENPNTKTARDKTDSANLESA